MIIKLWNLRKPWRFICHILALPGTPFSIGKKFQLSFAAPSSTVYGNPFSYGLKLKCFNSKCGKQSLPDPVQVPFLQHFWRLQGVRAFSSAFLPVGFPCCEASSNTVPDPIGEMLRHHLRPWSTRSRSLRAASPPHDSDPGFSCSLSRRLSMSEVSLKNPQPTG